MRVKQHGVYEAFWKHKELYKLSYHALVFQDQNLDHQVYSLHVKLQKHIKSASGLVNTVRFSKLEMKVISTE